jgi:isoprenylcysteine carboxyl methyltransferase (ICMT) family protein YpbQ
VTSLQNVVTWPLLTVVRSKRLQLSLSNRRGMVRQGATRHGENTAFYCCVIAMFMRCCLWTPWENLLQY